jgi:outer membrane lipoprotein-sorting protein
MNQRFSRLVTVLAVLVFAASLALAQMPNPFSADMRITGGRQGNVTGKMYFSTTNFRMEMTGAGHQTLMIADFPKKVMYMIMPEQKMYMEFRTDHAQGGREQQSWKAYDASNPCANETGTTCKKGGTEVVNERVCTKWEITDARGNLRTVWIDQKTYIPIKTVTKDVTSELLNIREGAQPASLFQIPPGYQKMDMGAMMQGMKPPKEE